MYVIWLYLIFTWYSKYKYKIIFKIIFGSKNVDEKPREIESEIQHPRLESHAESSSIICADN